MLLAVPSTPADAKGLLKASIRNDNPILFVENLVMYNEKGEVPDGDYTTPLGQAALRRSGRDLTVIGVSRQAVLAGIAAQRLEEEDVDVEWIDLRSIRPLDWKTLTASVKRTGRCLVVEEGWPTYGVGAEVAAGLQDRCFDYLDAPISRLGGAEVPMPYAKDLERAAIPSVDEVVRRALTVVGKKKAAAAV
jgi:pyruvate dehydrogenase E1 component beta subunit